MLRFTIYHSLSDYHINWSSSTGYMHNVLHLCSMMLQEALWRGLIPARLDRVRILGPNTRSLHSHSSIQQFVPDMKLEQSRHFGGGKLGNNCFVCIPS